MDEYSIKQGIQDEIEMNGVPSEISPIVATIQYLQIMTAAKGEAITLKILSS